MLLEIMLMSILSSSYWVWVDPLLLLTLLFWSQKECNIALIVFWLFMLKVWIWSLLLSYSKHWSSRVSIKINLTKLLPDAKVHWYLQHHVVHMPTPDTILSQLYSPNLLVHTIMISQPWAKLLSNNENHEEEA